MPYPNLARAELGVEFHQISAEILHKWFDFVFAQKGEL